MNNLKQPRKRTLDTVFAWLAENGMYVYGPAVDFNHKRFNFGQQDYTVESAIKLSKVYCTLDPPVYPGEEEDDA